MPGTEGAGEVVAVIRAVETKEARGLGRTRHRVAVQELINEERAEEQERIDEGPFENRQGHEVGKTMIYSRERDNGDLTV